MAILRANLCTDIEGGRSSGMSLYHTLLAEVLLTVSKETLRGNHIICSLFKLVHVQMLTACVSVFHLR